MGISTHLLALSSSLAVPSQSLRGHILHVSLARGAESSSIYLLLPVVLRIAQLLPLLQVFDLKETCSPPTPPLFTLHPLWLCWPSAQPRLCGPLGVSTPAYPFPIIRCECGLPRAGLRTLAALVQAWPRRSCTTVKNGQSRDGLFRPLVLSEAPLLTCRDCVTPSSSTFMCIHCMHPPLPHLRSAKLDSIVSFPE